jgi:hypothetical protein
MAGKYGAPGYEDGNLVQARFNFGYWLSGICELETGEMVFSDPLNHVIRYVHADESAISTLAGAGKAGHLDGPLRSSLFDLPTCLALGIGGSIFVTDSQNGHIRRISDGMVTTMCKTPETLIDSISCDITPLISPTGITYTPKGQLIVADSVGNSLCRVSLDRVALLAGGSKGFVDGSLEDGSLFQPTGVLLTPIGDLIICDSGNHAIRALIDGQLTTVFAPSDLPQLLPSSQIPGTLLGTLWPRSIVLGYDANLFVADLQGLIRLSGPAVFSVPLPDEMIQEQPIPPSQSILLLVTGTLLPCLDRLLKAAKNGHKIQSLPTAEILPLTKATQLLLCHCARFAALHDCTEANESLIQRAVSILIELANTPATSVLVLAHLTKLKELFLQFPSAFSA